MRIAITGAAGFVGSAVVRAALQAGHEVHAIDDLSTGHKANLPDGVPLDLADAGRADYSRDDAVVHCAAAADISRNWDSIGEREEVWRRGPELTWRVLERLHRPVRFVFVSSCCVYDTAGGTVTETSPVRATSIYAASKLAGEALVQVHHEAGRLVSARTLRLVSCVGPRYWHGHIADFVRMARETGKVTTRDDGRQRKSYVDVRDAAAALVGETSAGDFGLTINVSSAQRWSWRDTIDIMRETRPVEVHAAQRDRGWIGDPFDLDVKPLRGCERRLTDGVRDALKGLGWRE